jgi:predicted transcriptional regulator
MTARQDRGGSSPRRWLLKPSLESPHSAAHTSHVSTKQIVQDLLEKLPEDVSLHDVAQEIEFVAAVRQGLAEIDRGERIPIEEIERELPSWVIR